MKIQFLLFVLTILLVTGCGPVYTVEHGINNQTSGTIEVGLIYQGTLFTDISFISKETQMIFFRQGEDHGEIEHYFEHGINLSFDSIYIKNEDGLLYFRDAMDSDIWDRLYRDEGESIRSSGTLMLSVYDGDFK